MKNKIFSVISMLLIFGLVFYPNLISSDIKSEHEQIFKVPIYPNAKYEKKETGILRKLLFAPPDPTRFEMYSTDDNYETVVEYYKRIVKEKIQEGWTRSDFFDSSYEAVGKNVRVTRFIIIWSKGISGFRRREEDRTYIKITCPVPLWSKTRGYKKLLEMIERDEVKAPISANFIDGKTGIQFSYIYGKK